MKTRIKEVIEYLDRIAPYSLQESYDNSGLLVGDPEWHVSGAIVALDATVDVIEEAINEGFNLVLCHHPIIFSGLKSLTYSNYIEHAVIKAIKNDIAILSVHTNLDNVLRNGVNERIALKLDIRECRVLSPKDANNDNIGSGVIGVLPSPMVENEFLLLLKERMNCAVVRHTQLLNREVQKVAICGGSGSFLLEQSKKQGADAFITADFKYHQFFDADHKIVVADIGHYESEQYTIDLLKELLSENFATFAARCTKINTNPVKYL